MLKTYGVISGLMAGLIALFTPAADASAGHQHASDCQIFGDTYRALCRKVQLQHPYGYTLDGKRTGASVEPDGYTVVHRIAHESLTLREKRSVLRAAADDYATWVTGVRSNMDWIENACGNTDGMIMLQFIDADGRPGGTKLTWRHVVCA